MSGDPHVYKAGKNSIITLKITGKTNENRKGVVNPNYAKFRTDKALVIDIENFHTKEKMETDISMHDQHFIYRVGEEVNVGNYDENTDEICAPGIHYFKTKEAAEGWWFGEHSWRYRHGLVKNWYESGELYSEINYNNHAYNDGSYRVWHANKHLSIECNYKNGKLDGLYRRWYECGTLAEEKNYKEGCQLAYLP
jgi:Family of unknown function (DUF5758)/MORN repeat variant